MTPTPGAHARLSIRDFLTDGSLAALCEQLSGLSGTTVEVRDSNGLVLPSWAGPDHPGEPRDLPAGAKVVPMLVDGWAIGSLVIHAGGNAESRVMLEQAVELTARVATELCHDVMALRDRVNEIGVMYRLSALGAAGGELGATLTSVLEAALEALSLDAGSVLLLPEDADGLARMDSEEELEAMASVGLNPAWVHDPTPLSVNREFDRLALAGEVVAVEDLASDDRVIEPARAHAERLFGFLSAGLVYGGRPLGVIRLYARRRRVFSAADLRLIRSIGHQAAAAVEQSRLARIRAREQRLAGQLRFAATIQSGMMPKDPPRVEPFEIATSYMPSSELSGDFYDLFKVGDCLGMVVGDVVGKGVAAALLMSAVRATLRAHIEGDGDLASVMGRVNHAMCRDTEPSEFATVWLGAADPATLELTYCSAGHDPPVLIHRRGSGCELTELPAGGLVVGVMPGEQYKTQTVALEPGDVLVAYTDGIIDARNFDGQRYTRQRFLDELRAAMNDRPGMSAVGVLDAVQRNLRQFRGLAPQADDETLVIVRVGEPG